MKESHFSLKNKALYETWRNKKLALYPVDIKDLITTINTAHHPTPDEINKILSISSAYNLAFYRMTNTSHADKKAVHKLASACGLKNINHNLCADADSLTSLTVAAKTNQREYIPYTNRRLNWHTDGYYNTSEQQIHGMLLHCAQSAKHGGENLLLDHEIAYILLREEDPTYIAALMHPQAFTIPANTLNNEVIRPEQSGPVFYLTTDGRLQMRYSARQRNVQWRGDSATRKAEQFLLDLWHGNSAYKLRYTLQAGEGLLCNNVLHCRTEFIDHDRNDLKRLLYRGRYTDHLADTDTPSVIPTN